MQIQISSLLQKPTDLDLHCLLRQGMLYSAREGLNVCCQYAFVIKKIWFNKSSTCSKTNLRHFTFVLCFNLSGKEFVNVCRLGKSHGYIISLKSGIRNKRFSTLSQFDWLTLSNLGKKISRRHIEIYFLTFPVKQELTFFCKLRTIYIERQILFWGKIRKKNILNLSSAELAQGVVKVDYCNAWWWIEISAIHDCKVEKQNIWQCGVMLA